MKHIARLLIKITLLVLVLGIHQFTSDAVAQEPTNEGKPMEPGRKEWSPTQKSIWSLEKNYWKYLKEGNVDSLGIFWHDKFVGWPSHSSEPVDRSATKASLGELWKSMKIISYELSPQVILIHGKIAVVHYIAELSAEKRDGEQQTTPFRITHTWLNEEGEWKILGGMSAR